MGCLCWFPYRLVTEPRLIWLQLSGISLVLGIAFFVQLALKWPELTGAFPDPTVNPLPQFPEDSDDPFMQQEQ